MFIAYIYFYVKYVLERGKGVFTETTWNLLASLEIQIQVYDITIGK